MPNREYLVVVRAGPNSLHPRLLREDPKRNWDCCVNWWGTAPADRDAEFYVTGGELKLEGLAMFLAAQTAELPYRYLLALDDDVYFAPGDISRFFNLCDRHGIYLAQPALRWNSFFSHDVTLRNVACAIRRVTFVEVMTPCFSAPALKALRHTFTLNKSTYGIDWAWTAECSGTYPIHVVDEIGVIHTKPVDLGTGALYVKLRKLGIDWEEDANRIFASYPGVAFRAATCDDGHVFRYGLPRRLGRALMATVEWAKMVAQFVQFLRFKWRSGRRRLREYLS